MSYKVAGKELRCSHCDSVEFFKSQAQLNTAGLTLLGLEFLNRSATTYLCKSCGKIEWFYSEITEDNERVKDEMDCLACGALIPSEQNHCSKCDWTYSDVDKVSS